jgi:magnesium transporter
VRICLMYERNVVLSGTISISMVATVLISKRIGAALPMLAKKCHLDPALMAAPLISTIVDCCSIFIYFNIAMLIFNL